MIVKLLFIVALSLTGTQATKDPLTVSGRNSFIHLFEWKWTGKNFFFYK
jgi:hypothetical protein